MRSAKRKTRMALVVSPEEKAQYIREIEKDHPGFVNENEKLTALVRILTSIRVMYGLFYIYVTYMFGLSFSQGLIILVSTFFFFIWYSWMLRSGKLIAVMMLLFRGAGIATGGASLLSMVPWLPFVLNFTLTFSLVMEFAEAVFCIYVLFNKAAEGTIKLNRSMDEGLLSRKASKKMLDHLAEYSNNGEEESHCDKADENSQ